MIEEKSKPVKLEVDFSIKAFSKPLTMAFVISLVFLILFCLQRPNDNVVSDGNAFIMTSSHTELREVKVRFSMKQWHIRTDYYYNLMANLSKSAYKPIRPLLDPLPQDYEMHDPYLIDIIQNYFLIPPSIEEYALTHSWGFDTSMGQAAVVRRILGEKVRITKLVIVEQFLEFTMICNRKTDFSLNVEHWMEKQDQTL